MSVKSRETISVSRSPLAPESAQARLMTMLHAPCSSRKLWPSSSDNFSLMTASSDCLWIVPEIGGNCAALNCVWLTLLTRAPLVNCKVWSGADAYCAMGDGSKRVGAPMADTVVPKRRSSKRHDSGDGDQFWPPSRLTSVKMSKKLLIM